ncbi:MAG TPA: heme exporter protein CcmB [Polyangia bacterium]|nr:heme exporter protein CcmB [Polyangia bacterium]
MADPAPAPAPGFLRQALHIAAKDLRIEWRSREVFATMTFLAVVVVLIFSFAFVVEGARPPAPVVAGILWVAVVVSGTVALSRAFDREREGEAIRSLLLAPAPRGAVYIGKLAATVVLMLVTETVLTGLCVILFATRMDILLLRVVLLLALGTVGFAAAGCVFSAALLRARGRDALLATLLYPIIVPIVIAGARGTAQLLDLSAPDLEGAAFWTKFLFALDILFVTAGLWAFEPVVGGD